MKKLNALAKEARINANASIRDQHSIVINEPISKVWSILTNLSEWHLWNSSISNMKLDGQLQEKTKFSWNLNGSSVKSEIQSIKKPNTFTWTGVSKNIKRIYVWELEPDDNQTIVTVSTSLQGILIVLESHQKIFKELTFWLEKLKEETERK